MIESAMHAERMVTFEDFVRRERENTHQHAIIVDRRVTIRISADLKEEVILTAVSNQEEKEMLEGKFACIVGIRDMSLQNV